MPKIPDRKMTKIFKTAELQFLELQFYSVLLKTAWDRKTGQQIMSNRQGAMRYDAIYRNDRTIIPQKI